MATKETQATQKKTQAAQNGTTTARERRPSDQVLQVVDRAVGAVPVVAETVRSTVEEWRKPERLNTELKRAEERGADVRRQVTDQVVDRARKARSRVEPVYRERLEPAVRRVRQSI